MHFKRYTFLTLILFLTIFSISFVGATENVTYNQNTGELNTLSISDVDPIEGTSNTLAVDSIDEADGNSLGTTGEDEINEIDGCLTDDNGTQLLRSNNVEIKSNDEEKISAGNEAVLGAVNDEPILGYDINAQQRGWTTAQQVLDGIRECSDNGGGTVYLCGRSYSGQGSLAAPYYNPNDPRNFINIANVRVVGGSPTDSSLTATFNPGGATSTSLAFRGSHTAHVPGTPDWASGSYSDSGVNLLNVTFENLSCSGRFFSFNSGSLTDCVFNNLESNQHLFFVTGSYWDETPLPLTNCTFSHSKQTYVGQDASAGTDGSGQFGVVFGAKMVGCNFINTSSATHGGAFCLSDEYQISSCVASSLIDCNFINITSRWFAVYIHGNYSNSPRFISEPQVLDNCKFINCVGTGEYGAALGISHNDVQILNCEFINNTGGMGSAIMVGGIDNDHEGFLGVNTEGNNMTIDNCTFKNNVAKVNGQSSSYSPNTGFPGVPSGDAGAVYVYGNDTKVFNTVFENNDASNDGGAVYIEGNRTMFVNSTLKNSNAVNGTIFIYGHNTTVRNSTLVDNTAVNGAGIYVRGENTTISESNFFNNTADRDSGFGGAIDVIGNNCDLLTVNCTNNIANCGGAAFIRGNNTRVRNSTFDNNNATLRGGGLDVYGKNFTAEDLEVSNNNAGTEGGAVYVVGDDASFEDVTSINNTAKRGGSTFVQGANTIVINCTLDNNRALDNGAGRGGALDLAGPNCTVHDLEVSNNRADGEGGAIYIKSDGLTIYNINSTNNTAKLGGSTFIYGDNITVYDCIFDNNTAELRGGGLNVYGDNCNVYDVEVSDNNAGTDGGAVYVLGDNAKFTRVTSVNNTAARGGSTFVEGDNTTVINCVLDNNRAISNGTEGSGRGGALDLAGANCTVNTLEVSNNRADGEGGAIFIRSDNLNVYNINSTNNTALLGGSTFIYGDNITVHDCIFDGNNATLRGGGLNVYGDNCEVYNVDVSDNNAGSEGGAVYVVGNGATFHNVTSVNNTASRGGSTFIKGDNATVYNCTLDNNRALANGTEESGRGGGLDLAGANIKIYDLDVSDNFATNEGGAVYIKSSDLNITDIHSVNNSAKRGGAVYIEGDNITITDSVFNDNIAIFNESEPETSGLGGAVDVVGNGCSFINVTSVNNTAYRGGSTFVRGNNTVVKDCILDNNTAELRGGGINVAGDNCTIENVDVSNNRAGLMGGAIYVNSNGTTLTNITADNNTAQRGGAAFINGTNIIVEGGELNNNKAGYNGTEGTGLGGAFDIVGNNILVDGVHTNNNTAYRGGSTFIRGDNITVQNCNLDNNSAELRGGGINIAGDNCTVENVSVSNNKAGTLGGAIYVNSNGTRLINVISDNNTAQRGGAAFINGTGIIITGGELNNNKAINNGTEGTGLGGGFDIVGDNILVNGTRSNNNTATLGGSTFIRGNNVTVQNCNLDNNSAELRGGALDIGGGEGCQIINVSVSNNHAGTQGGAVYVTGDKSLFDNVTSIHNNAQEGGSSYINGTGVIVRNCNLDNNSATIRGGGLAVTGDNCTFENVKLSNCNATEEGGAVYVAGENSVFDNVTSIHNTANKGGSSYVSGNNITVRNCNLDNNSATEDGGGLYVTGDNCTFENVKLSNCNATDFGGAVYVAGENSVFDNVTSVNNTAMMGGSSYVDGNNITVVNCNLDNNDADLQGGGLYVNGDNCTFENVKLSNCNSQEGGAIYVDGDNAFFDNITSTNNTAVYSGGSTQVLGDNVTFQNSNITHNNVTQGPGGAIYISGNEGKFLNNTISYNEALSSFGGAIYTTGDNNTFSDNEISHNIANFGGAIGILGTNSNFTNNNITFNEALISGGAVYVTGWGDEISYFINNNISSNHAELKGGAICSEDENLVFDQIYAFNNTAKQGGFASITGAANLTITESTFIDNHALGELYYDDQGNVLGVGGAFYIAGAGNATVQGDFSWNTAVNGSAIYLDSDMYGTPSNLDVHDSTFYDNQAWSYQLLAICDEHNSTARYGECRCNATCSCPYCRKDGSTDGKYGAHQEEKLSAEGCTCPINCPCRIRYNESTIFENENMTIIVYHKGGDNIANGIYNNSSTVRVKNITYPFFTEDGREIDKVASPDNYTTPILEPNYDEIYQYPFENNQQIVNIVIYDENGTVVRNFTQDEIDHTDIFGRTILHVSGLSEGLYTVEAYYNETTYYTAIQNVTIFRVIVPPIVEKLTVNESVFLGQNVDFVVIVNNTLIDDDGNSVILHNVTITEIFKTSELKYVNHTNRDMWVIGDIYYVNETVGGQIVEYTCMELNYQDVLRSNESANFTITFMTLITGILNNTVNLTTAETGNYTAFNNTTVYPTHINVTKVWYDANNATGLRPANITVELLADGESYRNATLNETNGWKYTFDELPLYNGTDLINYTIRELTVDNYTVNIIYGANREIIIENTLVTVRNVTKIWNDGNNIDNTRPANIIVELYADGVNIRNGTLNMSNGWKYSFTDLPVYNGTHEIEYTVSEIAVDHYIVNQTIDANGNYVFTNTLVRDINVTKYWNDGNNQDNTRPDSIVVDLLANGTKINETILTPDDWFGEFVDLPVFNGTQRINYTIVENTTLSNYISVTNEVEDGVWVINNTLVRVINVTKYWYDGNNQDNTRPDSIVVDLLANGTKIDEATLTPDDWFAEFVDLPVFNGTERINYTIVENTTLPNYDSYTVEVEDGVWEIYNLLVRDINVTKIWNDGNNQDNTRPDSIAVDLLANGLRFNNATLTSPDWFAEFTRLPVFNGIDRINYTIVETTTLSNYVSVTNEVEDGVWVINNTLVRIINVTKIWNDGNNQSGARPGSIVVDLLANGTKINETILTPDDWFGEFVDLPVFNGTERIVYTIRENTTLSGYIVSINETATGVWVIENTLLVDVAVVKTVDKLYHSFNDTVVWDIVVTNARNGTTATNVRLVDVLPAEFTFINATPSRGTYNAASGVWTIGRMNANARATLRIVTRAPAVNGTFTNEANVTCNEPEWNYANNYDNATVIISDVPYHNKTPDKNRTFRNENVTYYITVENIGAADYVDNLTIIDDLPAGIAYNRTVNCTNATLLSTTLSNNNKTITWVITNIPQGATAVIEVLTVATEFGTQVNNATIIYPDGTNRTVNATVVVEGVDVAVTKTVDKYYHSVNDTVVWDIVVTNARNGTTATNVRLVDVLPAGFTFINATPSRGTYNAASGVWSIGRMNANARATLRIVTRAPAYNGTFVNEANVTCNEPEWNYANNYDNATVVISSVPDHNKTPDKNRTFRNENVTYYITVENIGAADYVDNLTIIDDLPAGIAYNRTVNCTNATLLSTTLSNNNKTITWVITNIPQGATAVIEVLTVATEFGTQVNNATIIYPDGTNRTVNATVVVEGVDVAVTKTVDKLYHSVNDTVVWDIVVTNARNGTTATNVRLVDVLPAGFTFINATPSRGTYNVNSGVWSIGRMNAGARATLRIVTRAPAYNGTFTNEANVTCREPEWNYANNYDNATVIISLVPPPLKLVNNSKPFYHENVTYYLTVENIGDMDYVDNLTVIDSLPDGVDYLRTISVTGADVVANATLSNNNKTITWVITNIKVGDIAVITVEAQANAIGVKVNNETVVYPDGSNQTVNATIEVQPIVDVSVDKSVGKDVYFVGDVVVWTIKVANAFNGTNATDVTLNDVLPSEFTLINYTSTKGNYTNGVWFIGFMGNGTEETLMINSRAVNPNPNVTNHANVTCNETEWNYLNNYDNATVTVVLLPPPYKEVNNTRPFYHENVTYYLTVINDGDYIYDLNATVIDSLPDGVDYLRTINVTGADLLDGPVLSNNNKTITWVITNIDPHSTAVIMVEAQANAVGVKVNNETVVYPDGSNQTVNATIEVQPIVDVSVVKTVAKDVYFVGDVVVWTIKVANAFNGSTATDVILNDLLPSEFTLINYTATNGNYINGVWTIGTMANGTEENLTLYTRAVAAAENVTNHALVYCNETEWDYTNNYDNATVTVFIAPPPYKEVNNTRPFLNENVTYSLTAINVGNVTYDSNLTVVDSLPEGVEYLRTINVTGADLLDGPVLSNNNKTITWVITNIPAYTTAVIYVEAKASAVGIQVNNETIIYPDGSNQTVNATIEVQPIVDVSVVKTVAKDVYFVGDVVVWTIKVANAFNGSAATDVILNDLLPSEFTLLHYTATNGNYNNGVWTIGTMANGTEETLTLYTRADAAAENVTNHALVYCNETEWDYTNNYDNATVTVFIAPPPFKYVNNTRPFYHENVTYYLTATNVGNVTYESELLVIDSLPDGVDYIRTLGITGADVVVNATVVDNKVYWVIKNIPAYSTAVIEVLAQANAIGVKVNNETIVYPDGSNQTVNATIEVLPIVDVSVIKTVDKPEYFIGDIVVWTVKVANAFNGSTATDVKLSETLPSQFTLINYTATKGTYADDIWTIGTMGNGTEEILTLYTRALTNGTFTNYVNVSCNETEWNYTNNYDNETVIIKKNPDINKTVNDTTPFTHEFVEYYLTVTNTVDIDYTNNLIVIDSLPEGLIFANEYKVDGADLVKFVVDGQKIYWNLTNISANSSAVITVKVLADKAGNLTNNGTLVPHYGNNITVNCTITPIPRADLEITKLVSKKVSHYNDRVTWTIIVKNNGPDTAENAVMSDKLPADLIYVSDDSKGAYNPVTGIWKLGDLEKGQSKTLKIVTIVNVTNKTIINYANVTSDTPDPNETNNKCNNSTTVPPEADLMLIKDVDRYHGKVGENFTFVIVVVNLGPDDAINTRAFDVLPDGLRYISSNASMGSYDPNTGVWTIGDLKRGDTVYLTMVAEALRTGRFVNEAYVVSDTYDPDMSNNYDYANVTVEEPSEPPVPPVPKLHPTGNPIVMVLLSLLAIVGVTLRRKL